MIKLNVLKEKIEEQLDEVVHVLEKTTQRPNRIEVLINNTVVASMPCNIDELLKITVEELSNRIVQKYREV